METIKNYVGKDVALANAFRDLEIFIGDIDGKTIGMPTTDDTFIDDGTVDADSAVRALNLLIDRANG